MNDCDMIVLHTFFKIIIINLFLKLMTYKTFLLHVLVIDSFWRKSTLSEGTGLFYCMGKVNLVKKKNFLPHSKKI